MSDRPHVHIVRRVHAEEPPRPPSLLPDPVRHIQQITIDLRVYWPGRVDREAVEREFENTVRRARAKMNLWFSDNPTATEYEPNRDAEGSPHR